MPKIFLILISIFFSYSLTSQEYDRIYRGARPMGLGGAFTAVSYDINALFYNPAGLNRIPKSEGTIFVLSPRVEFNRTSISVISTLKQGIPQNPIESLQPYIGRNMHINATPGIIGVARKNFALALLLPNIRNNTLLRRNVAVEAIQHIVADTGLIVGYSRGFLSDRLSIGADIKLLVRAGGYDTFDAVKLYTKEAINFKDIAGYGFGVDGDIGMMYTFNKTWFFVPTVGMSINNIAATKFPKRFESSKDIDLPDDFRLRRSLSLGTKLELPWFRGVRDWIFVLDVNNIGLPGTFFKKLHLGTEAVFFNFIGLRGGINQGYFTCGLSFDIPVMQIDIYTYGEELGRSAGTREDRRFGIQLTFSW